MRISHLESAVGNRAGVLHRQDCLVLNPVDLSYGQLWKAETELRDGGIGRDVYKGNLESIRVDCHLHELDCDQRQVECYRDIRSQVGLLVEDDVG